MPLAQATLHDELWWPFVIYTASHNPIFCHIGYVFGLPSVKRFASPIGPLSVLSALPCLSVTLVYCGQMVEWMKVKLGMEVRLDPGHIVLDGDPSPAPKGSQPLPNFWPMSVVATCMEVQLGPGNFVLDRDPAATKGAQPLIFGACLL